MRLFWIVAFLFATHAFSVKIKADTIPHQVKRPYQYISLAFDNCDLNPVWDSTRAFARQLNQDLKGAIRPTINPANTNPEFPITESEPPLSFTYFLSSVFFLTRSNKLLYHPPFPHRPGDSDIGFANGNDFILTRIAHVNAALKEGNEIASHLNGHFDASHWDERAWEEEFTSFDWILDKVFSNNSLRPLAGQPEYLDLDPLSVVGFRTPYLSWNQSLYPVLQRFHFRYDTSQVKTTTQGWPQKNEQGIWIFPLVELTIAGTSKRTLSMDYNFYVAQSKHMEDLKDAPLFEKQMYDTYMNYFAENYNGNRAPIHIGHHFTQMNGGAYWRAMQRFARTVCGLPEVHCINYRTLANVMDELSRDSTTLSLLQKGAFEKAPAYILPASVERPLGVRVSMRLTSQNKLTFEYRDAIPKRYSDVKYQWEINDVSLNGNRTFPLKELTPLFYDGTTVKVGLVGYRNGREISRSTRYLQRKDQLSWAIKLSDHDEEEDYLKGDFAEFRKDF